MTVYHFELRKFPHTVSRFNQSERELLAVLAPWVREEWVEVGERKWNVNETKLTVIEGPKLSLQDMAMNRGWRNARRQGEDVTERVLAAMRAQATSAPGGAGRVDAAGQAPQEAPPEPQPQQAPGPAAAEPGDGALLADSLALELLALLDAGPAPLARVWWLASERLAGRPASESLALAERASRSLLERGLAVLVCGGGEHGGELLAAERVGAVLAAVDSWGAACSGSVAIARKR